MLYGLQPERQQVQERFKMSLREATYADLVLASKVLAAAFKGEGLHGPFFHPYQEQYPDEMYLYFLQKLRLDWVAGPPDRRIILAIEGPAEQSSAQTIAGVSIWERKRAEPRAHTLIKDANMKAMEWYNYLESFIYPNRAAEPNNLTLLQRTDPFIKHHWTGTRADGWYLDLLGVDPAHGGKGIGRQLVAWGRGRAAEEGVVASLIASEGKERFYQACGFDVVGMCSDEGGEANEISKVGGGKILFWDNGIEPRGIKKYGEV